VRIVVITPTRGDRPQFMEHCRWLVRQQTLQPDEHIVIDYPPVSDEPDYYDRALTGLTQAMRGDGKTLAMFFEDDDYYRRDYIATMYEQWKAHGEPSVFGAFGRYMYNVVSRRFQRPQQYEGSGFAALCQTAVSEMPSALQRGEILDIPLWRAARTKGVFVNHDIFTSIKHQSGLRGTTEHEYTMTHGEQDGPDMPFLRARVDPYSFVFYRSLSCGA